MKNQNFLLMLGFIMLSSMVIGGVLNFSILVEGIIGGAWGALVWCYCYLKAWI